MFRLQLVVASVVGLVWEDLIVGGGRGQVVVSPLQSMNMPPILLFPLCKMVVGEGVDGLQSK